MTLLNSAGTRAGATRQCRTVIDSWCSAREPPIYVQARAFLLLFNQTRFCAMRTPGTWLIRASPFLVILRPSPLDHRTIPLIFATFIYLSMAIDSIDRSSSTHRYSLFLFCLFVCFLFIPTFHLSNLSKREFLKIIDLCIIFKHRRFLVPLILLIFLLRRFILDFRIRGQNLFRLFGLEQRFPSIMIIKRDVGRLLALRARPTRDPLVPAFAIHIRAFHARKQPPGASYLPPHHRSVIL